MRKLDKEKVFVSSTITNLEHERQITKRILYDKGYYPIMSESDNFGYAPNDVDSHDYCIDELLKCKQMICIIGKKYGGLYSGSKYRKYIESISAESNGRIVNPSISLMEFFVGRSKGIKYRVFVQKDVIVEKEIYNRNREHYKGDVDKEVFVLIDFINHLKKNGERKGNWFLTFDSEERLAHQIGGIDFLK